MYICVPEERTAAVEINFENWSWLNPRYLPWVSKPSTSLKSVDSSILIEKEQNADSSTDLAYGKLAMLIQEKLGNHGICKTFATLHASNDQLKNLHLEGGKQRLAKML